MMQDSGEFTPLLRRTRGYDEKVRTDADVWKNDSRLLTNTVKLLLFMISRQQQPITMAMIPSESFRSVSATRVITAMEETQSKTVVGFCCARWHMSNPQSHAAKLRGRKSTTKMSRTKSPGRLRLVHTKKPESG
jgi:hypothetical protein